MSEPIESRCEAWVSIGNGLEAGQCHKPIRRNAGGAWEHVERDNDRGCLECARPRDSFAHNPRNAHGHAFVQEFYAIELGHAAIGAAGGRVIQAQGE